MNEQILKLIELQQSVDEKDSYVAGFACGMNGADSENCHFKYFSRPSMTQVWERGKIDGENSKHDQAV